MWNEEDMNEPLLNQFNRMRSTKSESERTASLFSTDEVAKNSYPKNIIVSSRYTIITFFPKSLLEQFRRLANVYFLVLGIIAATGAYTNYYETAIEPAGILAPMLIVVMISVIKDGVEDVKRHNADAKINSRPARRVRASGDVEEVKWRDLHVGDTILVYGDDEIPADVVVLSCGGIQGQTCYVETAAIDGETNLKLKVPCFALDSENTDAFPVTLNESKTAVAGLSKYSICITAEHPNSSIHRFNGVLDLATGENYGNSPRNGDALAEHGKKFTLSEKSLLLRGSTLRATEWCVCMVIYTGADTKLSLNSKQAPSKLSTVDRIVNKTLLIAISTMLFVCVISMIFSIVWEEVNNDATYLCLHEDDLDYKFPSGGGCESGSTNSYLTIFTFATLYNNFVCISMYVSLEMVYLCQSYFLSNDLKLYDEDTDTPAECHTSGMCADLGQVQYVLSDKTGTLTKNLMVVKQFSVADKVFGEPVSVGGAGNEDEVVAPIPVRPPSHTSFPPLHESRVSSGTPHGIVSGMDNMDPLANILASPTPSQRGTQSNPSGSGPGYIWHALSLIKNYPAAASHRLSRPTGKIVDPDPSSLELEAILKLQFMRVLAYCNTAMLMPDEKGEVNISDLNSLVSCLQAESPDEVALIVAAAKYCGVLLTRRNTNQIESSGMNIYYPRKTADPHEEERGSVRKGANSASTTATMNDDVPETLPETVEIVAINEFDSDRKMMSILLKLTNVPPYENASRYVLYCKGADSSMLRNCQAHSNPHTSACMHHIDQFASTGLRTLVGAYREISDEVAEAWLQQYRMAANSITQRSELLHTCAREIEKDMQLLGAIGIEDELQDDVPWAIDILHKANINVWMITGDKAETALAIGRKCSLINSHNEVFRMVNATGENLRQLVMDLHERVVLKVNRDARPSHAENSATISTLTQSIDGTAPIQEPPHKELSLMVDGVSLEGLWASVELKARFVESIQNIPTVIACRVSPLQKAALVRMVKSAPGNPITLAIGDGANDVGMIHASRVGVGISGREGRHAANSADFAISQFKFLVTIMFEHGRYNYIRCSKLVLYSFFKNLLLVSSLFYYCTYSGFSGTVTIDTIVFSGYNFYLGLPVLALGALDFDIPRADVLKYPALSYATGRKGEMLNLKNMSRWCIFAFIQGLLMFVIAVRFIGGPTDVISSSDGSLRLDIYGVGLNHVGNGWGLGMFPEGFMLYTVAVVSMQYKIVSMSVTPNIIFWTVWVLSFCGYLLFVYIYGLFSSLDWYNTVPLAMGNPQFWLALFIIPVVLCTTDYFADVVWRHFDPSSREELLTLLENDSKTETSSGRKSDGTAGVALRAMSNSPSVSISQQTGNPMSPNPPA